jgi:hypothetical protein
MIMRNILLILCLNIFIFNEIQADISSSDSANFIGTMDCKIMSIKRHKDAYVIYLSCDSVKYKLVTIKEESKNGEKIKVGEVYKLSLYSYFEKSDNLRSIIIFAVSKNNFVLADEKTKELCYSTDLRGLYYSKSLSLQVYKLPIFGNFEIVQIQKRDQYFRIIARKDKQDFVIISKETDTIYCDRIKKGNFYNLELVSYFKNFQWELRFSVMYLTVEDIIVENDIETRDLFYTRNLRGLCFIQ